MDAFIGEIRSFPYGYVPDGWLACNGTVLSIQAYAALYSLIGNKWGGDGKQTFAVPDLRQRVVMGSGAGPNLTPRTWADTTGEAAVELTEAQLPAHSHSVTVKYPVLTSAATDMQATPDANNASWLSRAMVLNSAPPAVVKAYASGDPNTQLSLTTLSPQGAGAAHENRQPYLALEFCICWNGTYPSFS
ncbi:phage tail protein [Pseudomonas defluvii]|uniref:phage tail protein n=1 Tax=Pseudomonas defluvii TaxID=1876757 RepID=UPI000811811B|nr:tail fiber protein [Pseudomonas defluvii]